ncbi:hypothetical protein L5849_15625, partial [Erythrobacter sp. SN021]|uniref:hypothetical protein n=1 Tax=Erythrobacter sp. SN021 TaxID=2912574 RepID=UPI001F15ED6F
ENQRALEEALKTPPQHVIVIDQGPDDDDKTSENSHELQVVENGYVPRPEEDRITQAEKNQRINAQLKSLSADLAATKMETHTTRNDILHRQNVSEG